MPIAETAKLMSQLDMDTKGFDRGIAHASKQLGFLGHTLSTTLGIGLQKVISSGLSTLGSAIGGGIESLAALEDATTAVDAAIAATGKTGQITSAQVADWANTIESNIHAAFDDKEITAAAATLLRFGNVTTTNLQPALVVMTDLAAKTGDVGSAATTLAKALADPGKAAGKLAKQGIILDAAQQDQLKSLTSLNKEEIAHYAALLKTNKGAALAYRDSVIAGKQNAAQALLLDILAKKTRGAADATQGPLHKAIRTFRDVVEDTQRALAIGFLPLLERVAGFLQTKLAQPKVIKALQDFGKAAAGLFDKGLDFATKIPWDSIASALSIAAGAANTILNAFLKMPKWAQTAIITGAIAKIAIGAIPGVGGGGGGGGGITDHVVQGIATGLAGAIGKELISALGMGVMSVALVGEAVGLVAAVNLVRQSISDSSTAQATGLQTQTAQFIASQPNKADLQTALAGVNQGIHDLEFNPLNVLVQGEALDRLRQMRADLETAIANNGPKINPQGGAGTQPFGPFTDTQIAKAAADLATAAAGIQTAAAQRDAETSSSIQALIAAQGPITKTSDVQALQGVTESGLNAVDIDTINAGNTMSDAARQAGLTASNGAYGAAGIISSAIAANRPITNVQVNVVATTVQKTVDVVTRYGPPGGDRDSSDRNRYG